jgi:hypothetical protein
MRPGIQTLLAEAGEAGCYALDIIEIAERELMETGEKINLADALYLGIDRGFIYYNEKDINDNDNFFVKDPAAFLGAVAGGQWEVKKAEADYIPAKGEYVVDRWERVKTGETAGHFRLPDWDSLSGSMTVKYGRIVSKRVFRRIG